LVFTAIIVAPANITLGWVSKCTHLFKIHVYLDYFNRNLTEIKMSFNLPGDLHKRVASFLAYQRTCIICTAVSAGVWAIPVSYRLVPEPSASSQNKLDCLVPCWSDVAHHLTQNPAVVLIVQTTPSAGLGWLQIQGNASLVEMPDWSALLPRWVTTIDPEALYQVFRVSPTRIDLIDEDLGWGVQGTLEW